MQRTEQQRRAELDTPAVGFERSTVMSETLSPGRASLAALGRAQTALWRKGVRRRGASRRGQSTVEFMLMLPVLLAVFFFVIEMSLYFTAIHYTNYATFTVARAKLAGYRNKDGQQTATFVAELMLTGSALQDNYTLSEKTNGISVQLQSWRTTFPYLAGIMPDAAFKTTVNLGPNELKYESKAFTGCADNDMSSNPC